MNKRDVWVIVDGPRILYCELYSTAKRVAEAAGVEPPRKVEVYKPAGKTSWYGPIKITPPRPEDEDAENNLNAQQRALRKARDLGLSAAEIQLIQQSDNT